MSENEVRGIVFNLYSDYTKEVEGKIKKTTLWKTREKLRRLEQKIYPDFDQWKNLVLSECRVGRNINMFIDFVIERYLPFEFLEILFDNDYVLDAGKHSGMIVKHQKPQSGVWRPRGLRNFHLRAMYGVDYTNYI